MTKKIIFFFLSIFLVVLVGYLSFNNPKVSVVMSTYNRESFLPAAIESILNQTFDDFEFIIINDGSSDKTADILEDYARKDKRIRIITNKENKGLIYSLNVGLDNAKGTYVARMDDDDDVSLPTRLEKQYNFMEENKDFAVVSSWVINPKNHEIWWFHRETDPEKIKMLLYLNVIPISHPASFIRRSFLNQNNIRYNPRYKAAEDRKFWLDILDADGKITTIPEGLLMYRLHSSNPMAYYTNQEASVYKFFHEDILTRFGLDASDSVLNKCELQRKIFKYNQRLNLISQEYLKQHINQNCPPEGSEAVEHPNWSDYFVFDNNRLCRYLVYDCAEIEEKTDTLLIIKWDNWGRESFEKKDNAWILKR